MARRSHEQREYATGTGNGYRSSSSNNYNEKRSRRNHHSGLPTHSRGGSEVNHNGHRVTPGIQAEGESGRRGFHPLKFLYICMRSSSKVSAAVNILWPFVPAAIALVC